MKTMKKSRFSAVVMNTICLGWIFLIAILFSANVNAEVIKILFQGDTQKIVNQAPNDFLLTMDNTLTDNVTKDAAFILQMGDITEDSKASNWDTAQTGWRKLDGHIPYVLNIGNNDRIGDRSASQFLEHFPLSRYSAWPSFFDNYDNHRNVAHHFNAGGVDWLVISVRYNPTSAYMNWAEGLIQDNPDKKVIFVSHAAKSGGSESSMCKKYENVVLVLSGHTADSHILLTGNNGNKMGWVRTCHHSPDKDSYYCVAEIDTVAGSIYFRYYSPQYGKYWDDPTAPYHAGLPADSPWTWTGFDFGGTSTSYPEGAAARGEKAPNETANKAFDGDDQTKWLDFSPTGSWIQWRYAGGATNTVTEYTITSANDVPARDPMDWDLLGSNDEGSTWDVLDSRTGETFSSRFQRRSFSVSNPGDYNIYRLEITDVYDVATANSVQLAELELIGAIIGADNWTNSGGNRLWSNPANWSLGAVPTLVNKARIRASILGPIIDTGTAAAAQNVVVGDWGNTDTVDITGGSLTVGGWFILAYGASDDGTFNVSGGTTTVGGNITVARVGTGTMNMTGGSVTAGSFTIAELADSNGDVYLDGGTISSGSISMTDGGWLDITGGTLIVDGDATATINGYIVSGWITAYNGTGTLNVDYNTRNPGKTTLTANSIGGSDPLFIPTGAAWKYLDNGSNQASAWTAVGFNDSAWSSGNAQLGYGDGDEVTTVSYGGNASNKYITTYFRHEFDVAGVSSYNGLTLRLLRDDGAVVYLNGYEILRDAMPTGTISYDTLANDTVDGAEESTFIETQLSAAYLNEGTNVLAVEIHQQRVSSSDISFDLELIGTGGQIPDVVGLDQTTAEADIVAAGFTVGTVSYQYSDTVALDDVISLDPEAGTPVPAGTSVDLVVSNGVEMVTVPDVVGQAQATAEGNIAAAGLVVGTVTTESSEAVPAGDVISQSPTGGASVTAGSSVDQVVSTGTAPAMTRDWTNGDADRAWDNPANWNNGVPRSIDKAAIRNSSVSGPIIDSSIDAVTNLVVCGNWGHTGSIDITGGSLTTNRWFILAYGARDDGTFNVSGGNTTVGSHLNVGFRGTGEMNMTGGSVSVTGAFRIAKKAGSTGNVYLDGGTISSGSISINSGGLLDITAGTLVVNGDATATINGYIASGLITAYGGTGTLNVDYNTSNAGKTTVTAN